MKTFHKACLHNIYMYGSLYLNLAQQKLGCGCLVMQLLVIGFQLEDLLEVQALKPVV